MAYEGVTIGGKHTFHTWGLMLSKKPQISPPEVETKLVHLPGTSTVLDLSEIQTGTIPYKTRAITIETFLPCKREDWAWVYSQLLNQVHGRRLKIEFDDDPDWYYIGRVTVQPMEAGNVCAFITINVEADPYKHARQGSGVAL